MYGGCGEIAIVDTDGNTIKIINKAQEIGAFWTAQSIQTQQ